MFYNEFIDKILMLYRAQTNTRKYNPGAIIDPLHSYEVVGIGGQKDRLMCPRYSKNKCLKGKDVRESEHILPGYLIRLAREIK